MASPAYSVRTGAYDGARAVPEKANKNGPSDWVNPLFPPAVSRTGCEIYS
jgi:hypothetical protein